MSDKAAFWAMVALDTIGRAILVLIILAAIAGLTWGFIYSPPVGMDWVGAILGCSVTVIGALMLSMAIFAPYKGRQYWKDYKWLKTK